LVSSSLLNYTVNPGENEGRLYSLFLELEKIYHTRNAQKCLKILAENLSDLLNYRGRG